MAMNTTISFDPEEGIHHASHHSLEVSQEVRNRSSIGDFPISFSCQLVTGCVHWNLKPFLAKEAFIEAGDSGCEG